MQFGLPCRHWLYHKAYLTGAPIALNHVHPRWLLTPIEFTDKLWTPSDDPNPRAENPMGPGDRYRNRGRNRMIETFNQLLDKHESLSGPDGEAFAQQVCEQAERILSAQRKLDSRNQRVPKRLPDALPKSKAALFLRATKSKRGMRAIEAHELAEAREAKRTKLSRAELDRKPARAAEGENGGGDGEKASDEGVEVVGVSVEEEEEEVVEEAAYIAEGQTGSTVSPVCTSSEASDDQDEAPRRSGRVRKPSSKQASQLRREAEGEKEKKEEKGVRRVREVRAKLKKTPTQLEDLLN